MAHILLGVSSSISIYKSLDLVSRLKKLGHTVTPVLTRHAARMIDPGLFAALSGRGVDGDMFRSAQKGGMEHITLAQSADLIAVVPATANTIARLALGLADDLLGTMVLASKCPLLIAPAMNPTMYGQTVVQEHLATLRGRGWHVVEPDAGVVACGDYGNGKLASVDRLEAEILSRLGGVPSPNGDFGAFAGIKVLITAGGSMEPLDPVRAITNRSTGLMALSLARPLVAAGAVVTYLYGQVQAPLPAGARCLPFTTTLDLKAKLEGEIAAHRVLIMAAAPGDFRVKEISDEKIHREGERTVTLVPNPDILAGLPKNPGQFFVGFAAETSNLMVRAADKLARKHLDLMVANSATGSQGGKPVGIAAQDTHMAILSPEGPLAPLETLPKTVAAERILSAIAARLRKA